MIKLPVTYQMSEKGGYRDLQFINLGLYSASLPISRNLLIGHTCDPSFLVMNDRLVDTKSLTVLFPS